MDLTNNIYNNYDLDNIGDERWVGIPNYESEYQSSSIGRIKSLKRVVKGGNGAKQNIPEKIMHQCINNTGYCSISRTFVFNGKQTNLVHRIVAESFLERLDIYTEINHISGIKTDNTLLNLEWCTRSQNLRHAVDILNINTGLNHFRSKFTEKDVIEIFYSEGTEREIADKYKVSHSVIGFIKRKQSYKKILNGLD